MAIHKINEKNIHITECGRLVYKKTRKATTMPITKSEEKK